MGSSVVPGPALNPNRRNRNKPRRGDYKPAPGVGWQYGDIPEPPPNLRPGSIKTWDIWFRAWFASHWQPDMVPGIELVILAYDDVKYGSDIKAADRNALHALMRAYGITPDGQSALRWAPPKQSETETKPSLSRTRRPVNGKYVHLALVNE